MKKQYFPLGSNYQAVEKPLARLGKDRPGREGGASFKKELLESFKKRHRTSKEKLNAAKEMARNIDSNISRQNALDKSQARFYDLD